MMLVLNELSYCGNLVDSEFQAKSLYDKLFNICLGLEKELKTKILFTYSKSLTEEFFHADFPFLKWLGSQNSEEKTSILSMLTNRPFNHDYPYYKVLDKEGKGIGYAHENEELLMSFESEEQWKVNVLDITQELLNEETEVIEINRLQVRNCHDETSKAFHLEFLKEKLKYNDISALAEIITGKLLWTRRVELFPNLLFCDTTEEYIKGISGSVLQNLLQRLNEYEKYFNNWKDGDFDLSVLGGRPRRESETRERNFKNELSIKCPDNLSRFFTLHCNYGFSDLRLHFFPDVNSRKCFIGYIGKKIV